MCHSPQPVVRCRGCTEPAGQNYSRKCKDITRQAGRAQEAQQGAKERRSLRDARARLLMTSRMPGTAWNVETCMRCIGAFTAASWESAVCSCRLVSRVSIRRVSVSLAFRRCWCFYSFCSVHGRNTVDASDGVRESGVRGDRTPLDSTRSEQL